MKVNKHNNNKIKNLSIYDISVIQYVLYIIIFIHNVMNTKSILIVDDDEIDRLKIKRLVSDFEVKEAASGSECLEILKNHNFDCVILDHYLSDYESIELMEKIKTINDTPIIVVTGQGDERLVVKILKSGASDYLPKPEITKDLLSQTIQTSIENHNKKVKTIYNAFNSLKEIKEKCKKIICS